jgi:hypothetical protein
MVRTRKTRALHLVAQEQDRLPPTRTHMQSGKSKSMNEDLKSKVADDSWQELKIVVGSNPGRRPLLDETRDERAWAAWTDEK